jgi:hypothetical protein
MRQKRDSLKLRQSSFKGGEEMHKHKNLSNLGQEMSKVRPYLLKQTIKRYYVSGSFIWRVGWLVFVLILFLALSAEADTISGRVYDSTHTFRPGDEITISGRDPNGNFISVKVQTDKKDGSYRVFLPPGTYEVEFKKDNKILKGKIQSFPQPIQQNIYLIK